MLTDGASLQSLLLDGVGAASGRPGGGTTP